MPGLVRSSGTSKIFSPPVIMGLPSRWRMARARMEAARRMARIRREVRQRPVRVAFLVIENEKWSAQSVYEAMAGSPLFEPVLLLSTHVDNAKDVQRTALRTTLEENCSFARRRGFSFQKAFDEKTGRFIPLSGFSPDVVFYEQPYGLPPEHGPAVVSGFALTCYIPYGYGIYLARNSGQRFSVGFSEYLWRTFVESRDFLRMSDNIHLLDNRSVIPTGYPKMDALPALARQLQQRGVKTGLQVVYAPHHSIKPGEGDSYGTFPWNGRWLLEFARSMPEITWIFKPHPKLREQLVKTGAMEPAEVDRYFDSWAGLDNGRVILGGDYMEAFAGSDALITDSGSFLVEFLFTGKPILLLVSQTSAGYSAFGEAVVSKLYQAREVEEICHFIESVVIEGDDHLKPDRELALPAIDGTSGRNIVDYLQSELGHGGGS